MISNRSIFRIGYLGRLPLKTPYPAVVKRIRYIMDRLPRSTSLVVDYSGVGKGIYDDLVDDGLNPLGVTITGGGSRRTGTGAVQRCRNPLLYLSWSRSCTGASFLCMKS
jgi:hypothetical protein